MKKQTMLLGGLMLLVVAATVFLAIDYERNRVPRSSRTEAVMSDGTVLVVEHVSFGTQHSFQIRPDTRGVAGLFSKSRANRHTESTASDKFMIWMSRRSADGGRALDFDWWSLSTLVDEHGCEIADESERRISESVNSSSSDYGRPFRPLSERGGQRFDRIVVASFFPAVRVRESTVKLRVYNNESALVGELDLPNPQSNANQYPVWETDTLPATQSNGDLEVTVTRLTGTQIASSPGSTRQAPRTQVHPQIRVLQRGEPATHWQVHRTQLLDPLGNSNPNWNVSLCTRENAWKMRLELVRNEHAEFDNSEIWSVPGVTLSPPGVAQRLTQSTTLQDLTLELIGIGSGGAVSQKDRTRYVYGGVTLDTGSQSFTGSIFWDENQWPYEVSINPDQATVSVASDLPHLVAVARGPLGAYKFPELIVTDDQGRRVRVQHQGSWSANMPSAWFLDLKPDTKSIDLKFIVQRPRKFDFIVKPPAIEPFGLFQSADALAQAGKWQEAAVAFQSALDAYADNPWHWYRSACLPLEIGDLERYRTHCNRMVEMFGDSSDVFVLERTVKACLLSPTPVVDAKTLVPLADRALAARPQNPWFLLAKGITEYRCDRWEAAANWLNQSRDAPNTNLYGRSTAGLFLAMAQQRLGKTDEARETLRRATQIMDDEFPKLESGGLGTAWHDWLMAQIVRREAAKLVVGE